MVKKEETITEEKKEVLTIDANDILIEENPKKLKKDNKLYYVTIIDVDSGHYRHIGDIEAYRWVDPGTKAVYLKNEKNNFLVPFPETENVSINLTLGKLVDRILELESEIQKEYENDTEEVNEFDLQTEYMELRKKLRTMLYSSQSSFWGTKNGRPWIMYFRKGSDFHPSKVDTETSTVHTISNARNTTSRTLESNKRIKYGALNSITTIGIVFIICTFLMFGTGIYSWYKAAQTQQIFMEKLDDTELGALLKECRVNMDAEKKEIKESIISGVSEALTQEKIKNDPTGSGK